MSDTVTITPKTECPTCALTTWHMALKDMDILMSYGIQPSQIRSLAVTKLGMVFATGVGYDVLDADLLGGNGDGRRRAELERQGLIIRFANTAPVSVQCWHCEE